MVSPAPLLFHGNIVAYLMNKVNDREPKNFFGDRKIVRAKFGEMHKKEWVAMRPTLWGYRDFP